MATPSWLHGPGSVNSLSLTEGLLSVLKEQRPEYLPALLSNYREHGAVATQSSGAVGGLVGLVNAKLSSSKTRFEGLCLLSVLVKDSSSEVFQQHCLSWLRSVQQIVQSQAPLPSIHLAVSVLQDLLQFSSQLPELAREVGLNSTLGILTSLLGLKSECHLAAMEGMTACMMYYPRACGSLRDKLGAYFLSRMDSAHPKIQERACECYGRLPCLGGVMERGGVGGRSEGWTNQIHCLLASANGMLAQLYQGSETEGTLQYEGPGVELPYPLLDDTDPLVLLQVQHRYRALCLALTHTLRVDSASAVRLPVQQLLNLVCRALAVSCKSINMTGDGCVKLLMLPGVHSHTLEVLQALISAVGGGLLQYSSVLQRLFSQSLSSWSPPPEGSMGQQRAFSAVRVSVFKTLELWVRVGGASSGILQGSPSHSELLFAHLLGDITPGSESVKLRAGPSTASSDMIGQGSKPGPRRSKGLAVGDVGGASIQRKGDALANQDTCLSALRALRHIILTSGTLLKEDFHKRLHDVVLPLCVRLQQQARGDGGSRGAGGPSGQYGGPAPRKELYHLLLALVLVPSPRWPPPLTCAVSLLSQGRRDHSATVSSFCTEALTICNSLLHPRTPSISLPLPPLTLKPAPVLAPSQTPSLTLPTLLGGPTPGPPFPARHPLGLGPSSLLGSLENHLPLVPPGQPGHLGAPGEMLLSPRQHQAELAGLGLPESQRPVFVRYDKEEPDDVEISLNSDSDDSVVIVPPGMLSLGGQDCAATATGLPAGVSAATGSGSVQGVEAGVAGGSAMDVSLPNDLPPPSSTISITIPIIPPTTSRTNAINSSPPVSFSLVSLAPALNSSAQLTAPPGGLGDSLPGAQLQQMLLQTPVPGQVSSLGINLQMQSLHSQMAQSSRQLQQQTNEEDSAVININSSDEDEEDEMEEEDEEEEGLDDEEGSDYAEEDFYEGEEYEEEMEEEEEEEDEGLEDEEEEEEEEEEGEIPRLEGEGRRGGLGREEGEVLRAEGEDVGGMGGGFRVEGEREGGIEELGTGRIPYGEEGMKTQEVESIGVLEEEEREGEREGEEEENERMNDPTMPQILCVTGGALEEREETGEEEEGDTQEVRLWEPGANRMEGTSSSEEGPSNQQEQRGETSQETSTLTDDQLSNREGEEALEGGDLVREEVSSSAQSEKEGDGSERERGEEEDEEREGEEEDGKGVKRKREMEEGGGQGTEKKKLDEEVMASMLADFIACPPDDEDSGACASKQS